MRRIALLLTPLVLAACDGGTVDSQVEGPLAGGATTVFNQSSQAFGLPAPTLAADELALHADGDLGFEAVFVAAPAQVNGGIGPVFNQASCLTCHVRDGRGLESLLLRVSVPGTGAHGEPASAPGFGTQIQTRAVFGLVPEARVAVTYEAFTVTLSDGTAVTLQRPTYAVEDPYQPLPAGLLVSPRMARPVFGLGLLEAVPDAALLALADAQARVGEVSGRPNVVWDPVEERSRIGRFGWKANQPSLLVQNAAAFQGDMGVTNPIFRQESSAGQTGHADGQGDDPEIEQVLLDAVTFYTRTLGVPARRGTTRVDVQAGEQLFERVGCASCHTPQLRTGPSPLPYLAHQTIFPYSDLLLHDLGDDLADGRPDFEATGSEWRTPPLWGLGLTELVNGEARLLHDGRARSVTEAVLWHGGEAAASRERFRALSMAERDALLTFLRSL